MRMTCFGVRVQDELGHTWFQPSLFWKFIMSIRVGASLQHPRCCSIGFISICCLTVSSINKSCFMISVGSYVICIQVILFDLEKSTGPGPGPMCDFPRNIDTSKQVASLTRIVALTSFETLIVGETTSLASWDASCKSKSKAF